MEHRATEVVEPLDVGVLRMVQDARRGDDDVGRVGGAVARLDPPPPVLIGHAADIGAVPDATLDVEAPGHVLEVVPDLGAGGEHVAPLRVGCEGVAVQVGRDVAGDTRVRVLPPRAAKGVGLLVHDEVGVPRLLQLDGAEDAGHTRADDDDSHATTS